PPAPGAHRAAFPARPAEGPTQKQKWGRGERVKEAGETRGRPRHCKRLRARRCVAGTNQGPLEIHWRVRALGRRADCLEPGDRPRSLPHRTPRGRGAGSNAKLLTPGTLLHPVPALERARTGFMFLRAGVICQLRRALRSLGLVAFTLVACFARRSVSAQVPGELRGRVTDATTGRDVVGARVEIADRVEVVRSDGSGAFVVR